MSDTPNILFFFGEHHRWDWLGMHGEVPVCTPTLDRLAAEGTVFGQCRCNSPLCAPSRACLATGLRYSRAGVPDNRTDVDPAHSTFMKELRTAGYRVAVCGKTDLHKKSHLHGVDGWSARQGQLGFTEAVDTCGKRDSALVAGKETPVEPYMAWLHENGLADAVLGDLERRTEQDMKPLQSGRGIDTSPFPLPREWQIDDFCGARAVDMIRRFPRGAPWFLQINWGSAHPPFDAAEELVQRVGSTTFPEPVGCDDEVTDHQAVRRQYAAMLEGMDEWMGTVLASVEERGELANTIVVYSADHGEMLGDHGRWNKGIPLEPSVHVPLIVCGPGVVRGVQTDALVELVDLAGTVVELAGRAVPEHWDSRSLATVLHGHANAHRTVTVSALGTWRMVFDGRFKLVEQQNTPIALYDLKADPREFRNLMSGMPKLAATLSEHLRAENPPSTPRG